MGNGLFYIELIISVVLTIALVSTVVSFLVEWLNGLLNERGKMLEQAIGNVLHPSINIGCQNSGMMAAENTLFHKFYHHPLIEALKERPTRQPSYIPPEIFAQTLIQVVAGEAKGPGTVYQRFAKAIWAKDNDPVMPKNVRMLLKSFLDQSSDLSSLSAIITRWYDGYTQRLGGWFKRRMRLRLFIVSLILCTVFRIDLIAIVKNYYFSPDRKAVAVELADQIVRTGSDSLSLTNAVERLNQLKPMPLGWEFSTSESLTVYAYTALGIVLMAALTSFGAPFWFEVLVKLVNIRSTGVKAVLQKDEKDG